MLVVEIIGNLGGDATIKDFNGQKFISFSVAHTESFTDGQGQKRERTTWVSCLKYGESAVINYLKKEPAFSFAANFRLKLTKQAEPCRRV